MKVLIASLAALAGCAGSDQADVATGGADSLSTIVQEDGDLPVAHTANGAVAIHMPSYTQPDARVLTREELAEVVKMRTALGLRADVDYVQAIHENPGAYGAKRSDHLDLLGLTMTDDEIALQHIRNRLEAHSGPLATHLAGEDAATYGGLQLEASETPGEGTVLRIFTTDDSAAHLSAMTGRIPPSLRSQIRFTKVQRSLASLIADQASIRDAVARARKAGARINATDIELAANRIVLHVVADDATTHAAIVAESTLAGLPIVEDGVEAGLNLSKADHLPYGLVEGGLVVSNFNLNLWCTSGFAAHNAYGAFLLTAGHCGNLGDYFMQGGGFLGNVAAKQFYGALDAGAISTSGNRAQFGRFYNNLYDWAHPITFAIAENADTPGMAVCQDGAATTNLWGTGSQLSSCGLVQSQWLDWSAVVPGGSFFRLTSVGHHHGDSGASVLWPSLYGDAGVGILSGGFGVNGEDPYLGMVYGHLPYVLDTWHLTLDAP
jgi:hypothetical protein